MADPKLQIVVTAVDKATATLNKTGVSMDKLRSASKMAATAIAAVGVVMAKTAVQNAVKFEQMLANINTLYDDGGKSVERLGEGIQKLLKVIPKDADDLGASAYAIVSAGISDTTDALNVLRYSGELAVAGLGETAEATDIVTSAINSFGIDASHADSIANSFFLAVKNGKTTVSELARGFGQVAPLANSLGISFEELIATTSAMTTSGLKASIAYTQTRAALSNLIKPTEAMQMAYDELNITNIQTTLTNDGLVETMRSLNRVSEESGIPLADMFGSVEALNGVMMLLGSTGDNANKILADMTVKNGALSSAFGNTTKTVSNQFQLLKNNYNVEMMKLGIQILPKIIKAMEILGKIIDSMTVGWDKMTTALSKVIIAFDKIASVASKAFDAIKKVSSLLPKGGLIGSVSSAFSALSLGGGKADGGPVSNKRTYMVGENGPEMFTPQTSGNIVPNHKLQGGGINIVVNVGGSVTSERDLIDVIGDALTNKMKLNQAIAG